MTPPVEQPSIFTHRNHYLFADYYLDRRVGDQREWQEADAGQVFAAVTQLWRRFKPQGDNEAQTEADWIRPLLSALGHRFNVQVGMKTPLGVKTPDYVFYGDEAARLVAKGDVLTENDFRDALAVGDAKAWERSLDRAAPRDAKTLHENPSLQIDTYIRHSGLAWGILTNGRLWRLYHKDTSKKLDVYYEVDLPALIAQGDAEAFKYFWLFFRREAFSGDAQTPAWLDRVLAESRAYEQGVSANLKEQVYDALRCLAQGFLDFPHNGLTPTPETLRAIHDNSLIVLYRLLFMLYAEARDLLPVRENRFYAENYSLHALKQRIARDLDRSLLAAASKSGVWQQLYEQWQVINTGEAALGVPAYNGGLFRPENHPFIERYRVGDFYLRQAIDLLARAVDPATGQREFVDYRDLEIRHLGSIYEGLLEYRLEIADSVPRSSGHCGLPIADLSAADGGASAQEVRRQLAVVLVSDTVQRALANPQSAVRNPQSNARKATGSYYTPDYIVQYIVEQTVGPILEARTAQFRGRDGRISDEAGLVKAILGVNVLDPAMGSGHFLVAATDFMARHLVGLGLTTISGGDGEGELAYWRRRAAQSCIYGVDLNPLAVELAKLGLWLATVSKDKPLSFLDHHLRCGNSLIGARVADLPLGANQAEQRVQERRAAYQARQAARKEEAARAAGQLTMLDDSAFAGAMHTASGMMTLIEELGSETLADVHRAEQVYRESVRAVTEQARLLADIWTARHFGLALDDTIWGGLARYVLHGGFEMPQYKAIIEQGRGIAGERRFLHWELEFPEVFFDSHGRLREDAGFEAVIGNPPWVSAWSMTEVDNQARAQLVAALAANGLLTGHWDLYVAFLLQAYHLCRERCRFSFIVPNPFLREKYAEQIRARLLTHTWLVRVMSFGEENIFDEVSRQTLIPVFQKLESNADWRTFTTLIDSPPGVSSEEKPIARSVPQARFYDSPEHQIRLANHASEHKIIERIDDVSVPLGSICYVNYGAQVSSRVKGAFGKSDVVSATPQGNAKRFIDGKNLSRYDVVWDGRHLDYRAAEMYGPRAPALFESPKILIRDVTAAEERLVVGLDESGYYCDHLLICATHYANVQDSGLQTRFEGIQQIEGPYPQLSFLTGLLASRLLTWYFRKVFATGTLQGSYSHTYPQQIRAFPIRRIAFTTPADTRAALADEAGRLAATAVESAAPGPVLAFVAAQLAGQPERSDVIHDLLARLAGQMIALNEQRQAEMQSFLGWLGRESGARLAAFAGRTRLQNYLGDYQRDEPCLEFDDLLGLLKSNRRKLAVDPSRRAFQDRLRAEYAASLDVLLPIKRRLAAADRLIDRVVYVLYGLTEDEIAIVEGRAAATG